MKPLYLTDLVITPVLGFAIDLTIAGDAATATGTHPILVGILRAPQASLPLSLTQRTAIFTAAHAAYPA